MDLWLTLILVHVVTIHSISTDLSPTFYGNKCDKERDIEVREGLADVVFSGRVKSIHRNKHNSTYYCSIHIYRIMKGDSLVTQLLDLPADTTTFYSQTIKVSGFGSERICNSKVRHGDTRIFLASYHRESNLTLNSSLIRVGIRTLQMNLTRSTDPTDEPSTPIMREFISECKFFFCSFYAQCKLGPKTRDPYCECPSCENEIPEQVCASDGNWYRNICETRKASCLRRRRIKPVHPFRCTGRPSLTTRATPTTVNSSLEPGQSPANILQSTVSTATTTTTGKEDKCIGMECAYGAACVVSMDGTKAQCRCPTECNTYGGSSLIDQPVCGSDNKDYINECELRRVSCSNMSDTTVARLGKCDPCSGFDCPQGQACVVGEFNLPLCECKAECSVDEVPVCGTDGRTYDNECFLRHADCLKSNSSITIAYSGRCKFATNPCSAISCENYATCRVTEEGTATCRCPDDCLFESRSVVCGSNGRDYDNVCRLKQDACTKRINITVAANYPCENNYCLNYDCPHDGECQLVAGNPGELPLPTCVCPTCSAVIRPVCGEDGITYSSLCTLKQTNCAKERDVKVSHTGACSLCQDMNCEFGVCHNKNGSAVCLCPEDACVNTYSAVCADDGVTYDNMCQLTVESCKQQRKILKVSEGSCDGNKCKRENECLYGAVCVGTSCLCNVPCSDDSTDIVCGSDNQTYINDCGLQKKSCSDQVLITVAFKGSCDEQLAGSGNGEEGGTDIDDPDQAGQVDEIPKEICNTETNCKFDGICDYVDGPPGVCRCDGEFDFCEQDEYSEICGSDGILYQNICEFRETQCKTQVEMSVKPKVFCHKDPSTTPGSNTSQVSQLCYDSQSPVTDIDGSYINCSSCLPNLVGHCGLCTSDNSYCSESGLCCPKDVDVPECTYSQFGCCPYNKTLPSPGPDHRGCPYTCQCHSFGSNGALCDAVDFQCDCKFGVVGKTCDQCKLGWWGLRLIQTKNNEGCLPCQCNSLGSLREDCEQNTGRCLCKTGVIGLKCDACMEDGMILTSDGCLRPEERPGEKDNQEGCDTKDCGNGQCIIGSDSRAVCTCNYTCTDEIEYICASDGQTYTNICHLRRQACTDGGLMEVMRGACLEDTTPVAIEESTTDPLTTPVPDGGLWDWIVGSKRFLADEGSPDKPVTYGSDIPGHVTCADNPCDNGGICLDDSKLGFRCLCNVHWKGIKCQQVNDFTSPEFSGDSHIRLVWDNRASQSFDLRLTIIPTSDTGIILYSGEITGRSDFMSIVLNQGYVEFRFDTGGGAILLRSEERLITNRRYSLRAQRAGRSGQLAVEGQKVVYQEAPGVLNNLDTESVLDIGHVRINYYDRLPKPLIKNLGGVSSGFEGCLTMLHDAVANINFELMNTQTARIITGRNIGQCTSDPCLRAPCSNNGLCRMIDSFNYKCNCIGQFKGQNCDARSKRTRDIILQSKDRRVSGSDDDVFELPRFSGSSFIEYKIMSEPDYKLDVEIVFSTAHPDGVLLYGGQSDGGTKGDFLLLSIEDQHPVLRFDLGSGVTVLRLNELVGLRQWNLLSLNRVGKQANVSLNAQPAAHVTAEGEMTYLNIHDHITLGAIPSHVLHSKDYLHNPGFQGVIQRVSINGDDISDFFGSASIVYGVKKYHGPPCHPNPCLEDYICIPILEAFRCEPR